jgi:asparagine synthase (glutamine-hydrolysing)
VKSSNELSYAKKVCEETGIDLIEVDASNSLPFDQTYKKHPLKPNKPYPGLVSLKWADVTQDHIPSEDSYIFLSGHGSDHIFMRPPSKKSTTDYLIENGVRGYKKQLEGLSSFYRDPLYTLAKDNVLSLWAYGCGKHADKRNIKTSTHEIPYWLSDPVVKNSTTTFQHPIYNHLPQKILPGKYAQLDTLYDGIASIHMGVENQFNPTYYPFLYEPLLEFALSFPTYNLFNNGYDRFPLRKAVADTFKTDVVWRRDKSQTTGLFQLGVKRNLEYVLDLCLNGHFASQRLIDIEGAKNTINLISRGDNKHLWPFLHLSSIELFLRYWDMGTTYD